MYTEQQIKEKITTDPRWTERAVIALYKRQTEIEKRVENAVEHNNRGYNKPDSHSMSYIAKWILSGKTLSGKWLEDAQKRIAKYSKQLLEIANERTQK